MRPGQQQNKQRMRGRGRKGPNPMSRSYESNGPDVKIRGNAQHIAEKYSMLARDANAAGDRVMAENYLQHAEHYGRIVAAAQGTFQLQRDEPDVGDGEYEDGEEENGQDAGAPNGYPYPVPERAQGDRPQQPEMQGQRDYQNNRDNRDHQNRDNPNRDFQGHRDNRPNRDQRFNRDDRNRPRDFQNRDRNQQNNGDNRHNNEDRRSWEGRDRQNWQERGERQAPNGLGPQPVVGETPAIGDAQGRPHDQAARRHDRPRDERFRDRAPSEAAAEAPVVAAEAVAPQPMPQPAPDLAEREIDRSDVAPLAAEPGAIEPRRRGRPRRPRFGEGDQPQGLETSEGGAVEVSAPTIPTPDDALGEIDAEAPAKRRPGRPRKKKPEDEAGEDGENHLPDFLLASNG